MSRGWLNDSFYFSVRQADADQAIAKLTQASNWITYEKEINHTHGYVQFAHDTTVFRLCKFTAGRVYFSLCYECQTMSESHGAIRTPPKSLKRRMRALLYACHFDRDKMFETDPILAMRIDPQPIETTLQVSSFKDLKAIRPYHLRVCIHPSALRDVEAHCNKTELFQNGLPRCISVRHKCHLYSTFALIAAHTHVVLSPDVEPE